MCNINPNYCYRETIHRGIKKGGRKWIVGSLSVEDGRFYIDAKYNRCGCTGKFEVEYNSIGEMSGLRDTKSNSEIFEGDVVYTNGFPSYGENIFIFLYSEKDGRLRLYDVDLELYFDYDDPVHRGVCEMQVIGNIHNNPEYLDVNFQTILLKDRLTLQGLVIQGGLSPDEYCIYKNHIKRAKRQTRIEKKRAERTSRERTSREIPKQEVKASSVPDELPF